MDNIVPDLFPPPARAWMYQEMWSSFVTAVLSIVLATQATKSSKSVVKRA